MSTYHVISDRSAPSGAPPCDEFFKIKVYEKLEKCRHDDDDTETPDPVQAQIPSHPGIKYLARGIPPSDLFHGLGR